MKHGLLFFFLLSILTHLSAQEWMIFSDTANYKITPRTDTINYDYGIVLPYPASVELDLDCDSISDVRAICYAIPVQNFPPRRIIAIRNLAGVELEFLDTQNMLQAFYSDDSLNLNTVSGWESDTLYELHSHSINSSYWAGAGGPQVPSVSNMYIVFRKKKQDTYAYGWIKYSGTYYATVLSIHETAIQSEYCLYSNTYQPEKEAVKIYPNPVQDVLTMETPEDMVGRAMWRIYSADSRLMASGAVSQAFSQLDIARLLPQKGVYFFQLTIDGRTHTGRYLVRM
ncbi:MAG: T9SS type A sorting domain-containing protein [Saprospiraceae bacterium]|nr:T9SS type A sorting domain-containing protein [Saprospiraceae bacterium]